MVVNSFREARQALLVKDIPGVKTNKYLQMPQGASPICHDQRATAFHVATSICIGFGDTHILK
jgi:hypothetical protein